jgi:hypothetical protein
MEDSKSRSEPPSRGWVEDVEGLGVSRPLGDSSPVRMVARHPTEAGPPIPGERASARTVEVEAIKFSRYLGAYDPPRDVLGRYADACAVLLTDGPTSTEMRLVDFCVRHPLFLPALDSAAALLRPHSLLRRKLLIMAAVLETTPEGSTHFLPRSLPLRALAALLVRSAVSTAAGVVVGVPLLLILERRGRRET